LKDRQKINEICSHENEGWVNEQQVGVMVVRWRKSGLTFVIGQFSNSEGNRQRQFDYSNNNRRPSNSGQSFRQGHEDCIYSANIERGME